jgi:hypothetical protein
MKAGFLLISAATHLAYLFFYVDMSEDSWIVYLWYVYVDFLTFNNFYLYSFLALAFYIHLVVISFGFFLIEEAAKRILPEQYSSMISSTFYTLVALFLAMFLTTYCFAVVRYSPTVIFLFGWRKFMRKF